MSRNKAIQKEIRALRRCTGLFTLKNGTVMENGIPCTDGITAWRRSRCARKSSGKKSLSGV